LSWRGLTTDCQVPILATLGVLTESDLHSAPKTSAIPDHKCASRSCSSTARPRWCWRWAPTTARFVVSSIVPFAGRFVFERLVAPNGDQYIRILVNEAVIPLTLPGCGSAGRKYGLCELGQFIKHQTQYSQAAPSEWDEICYAPAINRTVPL
jgi:hypothetical protein